MKLYYYWYSTLASRHSYYATYQFRDEAEDDHGRTLKEGRWAGPIRSVTMVEDKRPASPKRATKRGRK